MPIRPENAKRYPKDWKTVIVPRIRGRSGNRCECTGQCGQQHYDCSSDIAPTRCRRVNAEIGYYGPGGEWSPCLPSERGQVMEVKDGKEYKAALITLTTMHLNHQPEDNHDENLLHGCQGCHNRYDAPTRRAGIKLRAKAARAAGDLFQCAEVAQ